MRNRTRTLVSCIRIVPMNYALPAPCATFLCTERCAAARSSGHWRGRTEPGNTSTLPFNGRNTALPSANSYKKCQLF